VTRLPRLLDVVEYTDPLCPWAWGSEPGHVATELEALLIAVGARAPTPSLALRESQLADTEHIVSQWVDGHVATIADALRQSGPAR
jgi:hypothetical protein